MLQPGSTYSAVVGAVIANQREILDVSQAQLAEAVGIGQPAWSRIEKGESALTIDQLARAASKLNSSPSELLLMADRTVMEMKEQELKVSYEKPQRKSNAAKNTGLLLLGGAALATLIYAANKSK